MRNYFKMKAMKWFGTGAGGTAVMFAWGGTDEQLLSSVLQVEAETAQLFGPNFHAQRTPPQVCYWELNQKNFALILQTANSFFWNNSRLGVIGVDGQGFFHGITRLKGDSPRSVFPTAQGTDGQRLRRRNRVPT